MKRTGRLKEEPLPGHKEEKRKKRRWDRKPEVYHGFGTMLGEYTIYTSYEVPHITFREKKKKK